MTNFYDNPMSFPYMEIATLIEDIKIPIPEKLSLNYFEPELVFDQKRTISGNDEYVDIYHKYNMSKEYEFIYDNIENISGKFSIPLLTPSNNNYEEARDNSNGKPNKAGFSSNIRSKAYSVSNYVELIIPKYLLYQFIGKSKDNKNYIIPKGTEFIICAIGGYTKLEYIRIIGIYSID